MKTILLTTTAIVAFAACSPQSKAFGDDHCDVVREIEARGFVVADVYNGNKGIPARRDQDLKCDEPTLFQSILSVFVDDDDDRREDSDDTDNEDTTDEDQDTDTDDGDDESDTGDDGDDGEDEGDGEEKTRKDNGWGNGDDAAPGRSIDRNNAENSDRTHHIHGAANRN